MIPHQDSRSSLEITARSKSSFALAFRLMPRAKTAALIRLYAFFRIADDCVDSLQGEAEKTAALAYWREQMHRAYRDSDCHPVMLELRAVVQDYQIPQAWLDGLMDGCAMDICKTRYASFAELYEYSYRVAGLVGLCCMKIFGYQSRTSDKTAIALGLALQITNILRDVSEDFARGRIYIPQDILRSARYSEEDLANHLENAAFRQLMRDMAMRAEAYFKEADLELTSQSENKDLRPARLMRDMYRRLLDKMTACDFRVLSKRISLGRFDKLRIVLPYLGGWR